MNWDVMTFVIKIAGLLSACGGPMLVMDRLKGTVGILKAFWIGILPVGLMVVGAFHLTALPGDRWARWAVEVGRVGMYVMVGMQLYGIWLILDGLRSPALPLYVTGIAIGLLSAVAYQWAAARLAALERTSISARSGSDDHRPIEPS